MQKPEETFEYDDLIRVIPEPQNWKEFFEDVKARPGFRFDKPSIHGLQAYLLGFWAAERYHNISADHQMSGFDFRKFEEWVAHNHNLARLNHNSCSLAASLKDSEEEALHLWLEWYDAFMNLESTP